MNTKYYFEFLILGASKVGKGTFREIFRDEIKKKRLSKKQYTLGGPKPGKIIVDKTNYTIKIHIQLPQNTPFFEQTLKMMQKHIWGRILMFSTIDKSTLNNLPKLLKISQLYSRPTLPTLLVGTHTDKEDGINNTLIEEMRIILSQSHGAEIPYISINSRLKNDVRLIMRTLIRLKNKSSI